MENKVWQPSMSQAQRDVRYSCGACGFSLNLSSSDRLISRSEGAKIFSPRRKQVLEFVSIDDSRFLLEEVLKCYNHRVKILCRKCGASIGRIRESSSSPQAGKRYCAKIRALHPEHDDLRLTY